jgi:hypothetical protein
MRCSPTRMSRLTASLARRVMPWLCLLALTSTVAHAMQVSVDVIPSATIAAPPTPSARSVVVIISSWDAVDHLYVQTACATSADRVSTDELLLNAEDIHNVSADLCQRE